MKTIKIILMFLLLKTGTMLSQNQIPYGVISSGVGKVSGTSNIINLTIGEAFVGKVSSSNNIASMGFWDIYVQNKITSVEEEDLQPTEFRLEQNYPNPFNPSTTISWQSPISGKQTIKLFDMLGREIETIVDGYYEAGNHSTLYIPNSTLSSGVYFYQLKVADTETSSGQVFVQTKKMILIK